MLASYILKDDTIYTSNNGCDNKKNPYIPLEEFLEDCCWVDEKTFMGLIDDMYQKEIKFLPFNLKSKAVPIIVDWKKNFNAKKEKFIQSLN